MSILQYPVATEKALNLVERENVITYVVDIGAGKPEIKKEFESTFKVKVIGINTVRTPYNRKRAYIRLTKEFPASEIAKRLKLV